MGGLLSDEEEAAVADQRGPPLPTDENGELIDPGNLAAKKRNFLTTPEEERQMLLKLYGAHGPAKNSVWLAAAMERRGGSPNRLLTPEEEAGVANGDVQRLTTPEEEAALVRNPVRVDKVMDGDTFRGRFTDLAQADVRTYGIDAPESSQGQWGKDAKAYYKMLTEGKEVDDQRVGQSHNREVSRLLAKDRTDIGVEMVRAGYAIPFRAFWDKISPAYARLLENAEGYAKANQLGMYGKYDDGSNAETPEMYRKRKNIEAYDRQDEDGGGKDPETDFHVTNPWLPYGEQIPPKKKEGALATIAGALNYWPNVVMSAERGAIDSPKGMRLRGAFEEMKQALAGKRETSAQQLIDTVNLHAGDSKYRFGVDNDNNWTFGDALDVALQVGVQTVNDPLFWFTGGIEGLVSTPTRVIRAFQAAKVGAKVAEVAPAGTSLFRGAAAQTAIRGVFGAGAGLGATGTEDPLAERIAMVAAGFTVGALSGSGKAGPLVDMAARGIAKGALAAGVDGVPGSVLADVAAGKTGGRGLFNAGTEWYLRKTGRGATEAVDQVTGRKLTDIYADLQSGKLEREAAVQADALIAPAANPGESISRQKLVQAKTAELVEAAKAPLQEHLVEEATKIVDDTWHFGPSPGEAVRREDLINKTAASIEQVRLSGVRVTDAAGIERAGAEVVAENARFIGGGVVKSLEPLDDAQREIAYAYMREGKEYFKKTRNKLFKGADFDPNEHIGAALWKRVEVGDLSVTERQTLVENARREWPAFKETVMDKHIAAGKTSDELNAIDKGLEAGHDQKMIAWERGNFEEGQAPQVYNILNRANTRKFNILSEEATAETKAGWEKAAQAKLDEQTRAAVESWKTHNAKVMEKYNREVVGVTEPTDVLEKGTHGIDWHTSDVFSRELAENSDKLLSVERASRAKLAQMEGGTGGHAVLGEADAHLVYSRELARSWMTLAQKQAAKVMNGYRQLPAKQGWVNMAETALGGFDKLTNLAKANFLYFSESWMKNNYWDNLAKAYIEGGLATALDAARLGAFQKGLAGDLRQVVRGEFKHGWKTPDLEEAVANGVLEGNAFRQLVDEAAVKGMNRDNPLLEDWLKNEAVQKPGMVVRVMDGWTGAMKNSVGRLGSYVESNARFITWRHLKAELLKQERYVGQEAQAGRDAAAIVKKTFFDYGDVTMMEAAVFKRMIPFYSFYSKNLPYWTGALMDPTKVARIATYTRVREGAGHLATKSQSMDLAPWLKQSGARYAGKDDTGGDLYLMSPSQSLDEAFNWVRHPVNSFVGKLHPIARTGYEVAAGQDLFSGGPLTPSQIHDESVAQNARDGSRIVDAKKFLYSAGFTKVLQQAIGEKLGLPKDFMGVYLDAKGNPYAVSDGMVITSKILDTLFPMGFVDQMIGDLGKMAHDKMSWRKWILNRLSPLQEVDISPQMRAYNRHINEVEAAKKGGKPGAPYGSDSEE